MKDSSKNRILDILSSAAVISVLLLMLVIVSWSGGVLNDIKKFDVVKNSVSKVSSFADDLNATQVFKFSENKIIGGYKFTLSKMKYAKDSMTEVFFASKDQNSTIKESNISLASSKLDGNDTMTEIKRLFDKNSSKITISKKEVLITNKPVKLVKKKKSIKSTLKAANSDNESDLKIKMDENSTKEIM